MSTTDVDWLLEMLSDGVVLTDERGVVTRVNAALAAMIGVGAEALVGRPVAEAVPVRGEWSSDSLLEPPREPADGRLHGRDGTHRLVHVRHRAQPSGGRVYVVEDRTELRKLNHRLAYADRLANAGALAASWLAGVDVPLQAAERCCGPTMTQTRVRVQRAAALLADPWSAEDHADPPHVAAGVTPAAGAQVVVELNHLPKVAMSASTLRQALSNLVDNARHANARTIRISGERVGAEVRITVADDGDGLTLPRDRALLPYATTRSGAQGLGLSVVRDLATAAGGGVTLSSDETGTRVVLWIPVAPGIADPVVSSPETVVARRILVVDDEPAVLRMVGRVLAREDMEVVGVPSAVLALERLRAGEHFDAVLCDVEMPELDGVELARQVARDRPELAQRVALVSGSATTLRAAVRSGHGLRYTLTKPFRTAQLRALLDEMFAEGGSGSH